jgi:hypothetical protein
MSGREDLPPEGSSDDDQRPVEAIETASLPDNPLGRHLQVPWDARGEQIFQHFSEAMIVHATTTRILLFDGKLSSREGLEEFTAGEATIDTGAEVLAMLYPLEDSEHFGEDDSEEAWGQAIRRSAHEAW